MAKVFDLSNLDIEDGFRLDGVLDDLSVSGAGDVNNDGIADMIVGASYGSDTGKFAGKFAGEAYVVFGRDVAGGAAAFGNIDLSALDPTDGFIIQAATEYDRLGYSVSDAGDVNGDGIADLIVGANRADDGGKAYVVFGRDVAGGGAAFGTVDLSTLNPADGFVIEANWEWDSVGWSVSGAGDVNGDGIDDLIVGAPQGGDGGYFAGEATVVFGRDVANGATAFGSINFFAPDPADGFVIQGDNTEGRAGYSVSGAGDVNNDGLDDLIVGAPFHEDFAGAAYVIFGRDVAGGDAAFGTIDLSALDPSDGFIIQSDARGLGISVSDAGDVNGDGIDDLIVAANGSVTGVIFGRDVAGADPAFGTIDLATLDPADGFIIQGPAPEWLGSTSVSSAGDVNGDGTGDLIVGFQFGHDGNRNTGEVYVIYGRDVAHGAAAFDTIDLFNLDPADGFIIQGAYSYDQTGNSVSGAGDVNGDGFDDLIVGKGGGSYIGQSSKAYVIYGKPPSLDLRGDATANTLTGDANDDRLRGFGGADLLQGGLGDDLLRGGADDDELHGGKGNDLLYGNKGNDTLFGDLGDDMLQGRSGDDVIEGGDGDDFLIGNRGADRLIGGAGDDKLKGGPGQDYLEGGAGADRFFYRWVSDSQPGTGDTIGDFEAGDRIVLRSIDADTASAGTDEAFTWLADAAFTNTAGELRFAVAGADTLVQADVDGDGAADLEITLTGIVALTADAFIL